MLVYLSSPGQWDEVLMDRVKKMFSYHDISLRKCDTVSGWANNNQDWLEGDVQVELSWSWGRPVCLSDVEWNWFLNKLATGKLLMMFFYKKDDGWAPLT